MKSIKTEIFYILRDTGLAIGAIVSLILTVVGLGAVFGFDFGWISSLGWVGVIIFILTSLFVAVIYSIISLIVRLTRYQKENINIEKSEPESANKLSIELARSVERSYKAKDYIEVVRFGSQLSRPLWLSGMLKERVIVGEMIEDAAAREGMHEEQVRALIDDLGWTNAVLGQIEKAENYLYDGIKLAIGHKLYYDAAKGERHLAAISQRYKQDWEGAIAHYNNATAHADQIENPTFRDEMLAGLRYCRAELLLSQGKYADALTWAEDAREAYEKKGDEEERLVKLYSMIGSIYLGLNEIQRAKDAFRAGLVEAQRMRRRDEMATNLLGLGEVLLRNKEYKKASETLAEAAEICDETGMKQAAYQAKSLKIKADAEL